MNDGLAKYDWGNTKKWMMLIQMRLIQRGELWILAESDSVNAIRWKVDCNKSAQNHPNIC